MLHQVMNECSEGFAMSVGSSPLHAKLVKSNFRKIWLDQYLSEGLAFRDPIAINSLKRLGSGKAFLIPQNEMRGELYERASEFSANSNISISTFFGGSMSIAGAVINKPTNLDIAKFEENAAYAHRLCIVEKISQLTDRQLDVLDLAECGINTQRIAAELGVREITIAKHKRAILDRLGIRVWSSAVVAYSHSKWNSISA